MPAKKANQSTSKPKPKTETSGPRRTATRESSSKIVESSSQIVREAALLLDAELASGILAAKQVQQRFQRERRVDPADFKEAVQQLQAQAHEVVNQLSNKITEASSSENVDLLQKLVNNGHDLLDLAVQMLNTGAELADQLAQSPLLQKQSPSLQKTDAQAK